MHMLVFALLFEHHAIPCRVHLAIHARIQDFSSGGGGGGGGGGGVRVNLTKKALPIFF